MGCGLNWAGPIGPISIQASIFSTQPFNFSGQLTLIHWAQPIFLSLVNWKTLTMKFKMGEMPMTLQGDPCLCNSLISLKAMFKTIKGEGEAVLLELCSMASSYQQPQDLAIP